MFGGASRIACLVVATWALLFAPGAAMDDGRVPSAAVTSERIGAAVLAPTFGADAFVTSRPCRVDDAAVPVSCHGPLTALPVVLAVIAAGALSLLRPETSGDPHRVATRSWSTRGPPPAH